MQLEEQPRRQRVVDNSNGQARRAVADTIPLFGKWRLDLARFEVIIARRFTADERQTMLARCAEIEAELLAARTELIVNLAEAPQQVAGHSRVVDVERALDNIETSMQALRGKLTQ